MIELPPPLRAAFIGAGQMARAHLRALGRTHDRVVVVGVHDADITAANAFAAESGARAFASRGELLAGTQPDIVHICTPAGLHRDAAQEALDFGAHVYVEKPFVETVAEAEALIASAVASRRILCAGHQLLADPAYTELCARMSAIGPFVSATSSFSFQSPTLRRGATTEACIAQLIDILPHPLYALVDLLERLEPHARAELVSLHVMPTSIDATLVAGQIRGRLAVDLRARPVASTMAVTGGNGTLAADFIRGCVTGLHNPGTAPLEKAGNQVVEGAALAWRSGTGVVRRMLTHGEYPGLVTHLDRFHAAIRTNGISPTSAGHLRSVATLHETISDAARRLIRPAAPLRPVARHLPPFAEARPVAVLTGANGFLGHHLTRRLVDRGFSVWGVGRGAPDPDLHVDRWIRADLSRELPADLFEGASIVVHAAAATSGGFDAHQRHSINAAENVLRATERAGIRRFIHVSSISVLFPPSSVREVQHERTPLATPMARSLGPYTWGKCVAESRVRELAAAAGIDVRVIRPGAFFDPEAPEIPGLVGKRLFGRWHLGLGRPSHPFAAIAIDDVASAIAWCADEFSDAPPIVNLFDPQLETREDVIARLRESGWNGRLVWVPISLLSFAATAVVRAMALARGKSNPDATAIWQVLRPRRFDPHLSSTVYRSMRLQRVRADAGPLVAA